MNIVFYYKLFFNLLILGIVLGSILFNIAA